jgi:integrase
MRQGTEVRRVECRTSPHDLRHTCASALLSAQWGRAWTFAEVNEFLGHASVVTTERYAKFAGDALLEAARETNGAGAR